jgi:hypothetical protein
LTAAAAATARPSAGPAHAGRGSYPYLSSFSYSTLLYFQKSFLEKMFNCFGFVTL